MLVLAVLAGSMVAAAGGLRSAALILGAVAVFALVSYGAEAVRQTGIKAPESISVDGQPYPLEHGRSSCFSSTRSVCTASTPRSGCRN